MANISRRAFLMLTVISPLSGVMKPQIHFIRTVLPLPLCPIMPMISERSAVKSIDLSTVLFPHSHASLLANEGINIQEVARRLEHSNVHMTWNTYSHLYPREEERAVEVLNKVVEKSKNA